MTKSASTVNPFYCQHSLSHLLFAFFYQILCLHPSYCVCCLAMFMANTVGLNSIQSLEGLLPLTSWHGVSAETYFRTMKSKVYTCYKVLLCSVYDKFRIPPKRSLFKKCSVGCAMVGRLDVGQSVRRWFVCIECTRLLSENVWLRKVPRLTLYVLNG